MMKKKLLSALVAIVVIGLYYYFDLPVAGNDGDSAENVARVESAEVDGIEIPKTPQGVSERILKKTNYTVSFNKKYNVPNWVAWGITAEELVERESRTNEFEPDPELPASSAVTTEDYIGSGYDRGHMCPAADNRYHWRAMDECFYMTNMCPQNHNLNTGVWNDLEQQCRRWVDEDNVVYVVCGPVFYANASPKYIGRRHKVRVPDAFFKVVLRDYEQGRPKASGYIFENKSGAAPLRNYACSIDEVEEVTGIDFFQLLPDGAENKIESMVDMR